MKSYATWRRALANVPFRRLWMGSAASQVGDRLYEIAVMWQVFATSHSVLQTGLVPLFRFVALLVMGLLSGVAADRLPRKRLMLGADLASIGTMVVVGLFLLERPLPVWVAYASVFVLSATGLLFEPAAAAALPDMVANEQDLLAANGLLAATRRIIRLATTAVAGLVMRAAGLLGVTVINLSSFAVSWMTTQATSVPSPPPPAVPLGAGMSGLLGDVRAGLKALADRPLLVGLLIVGAAANFGGGLVTGLTPVLVARHLHAGVVLLGILAGAGVAGELIGFLVTPFWGRTWPLNRILTMALSLGGAATIGMGVSHAAWLLVALFSANGMAVMWANLPIRTLLLGNTPTELRGRVLTGFAVVVNLGSPIAIALGAVLAQWRGVGVVYAGSGTLTIMSGLLALTYVFTGPAASNTRLGEAPLARHDRSSGQSQG